jgi:hypothetical protein
MKVSDIPDWREWPAVLMVRAYSIALANSGRTVIRVLIFSEKIGSQLASRSASCWLCGSALSGMRTSSSVRPCHRESGTRSALAPRARSRFHDST